MVAKFQLSNNSSFGYLKVIACALVFSFIAVILSSYINSLAFEAQPMTGDNASQYSFSANSYLDYLYTGRLAAIWNAYFTYLRPIWSILPLLVDPALLVDINGHIVVGGLFLFCFLFIMGISIFKRTGSILYTILCMLGVLSASNFYHYTRGMGSNYTDLQTSWLVGAALFSLINSNKGQDGRWLVLFGVFSALAQQSRFVSLGVIGIVCGPIFLYYVIKRWRYERSTKSLYEPLIQGLIPILIISGYSLVFHTLEYLDRYFLNQAVSSGLSNMFKPVEASISLFLNVFIYHPKSYHLGGTGVFVLLLFFFLYFVIYWPARANNSDFLASIWAATAFILLHVFILRIANEWIYTVYTLPGLYLLAFLPFEFQHIKPSRAKLEVIQRPFYYFLFIALIIINITNFSRLIKEVNLVSEFDQKILTYQKDLSAILIQLAKEHYPNPRTMEDVPSFETFIEIGPLSSGLPVYNDLSFRHHEQIRWVTLSRVWKGLYQMKYPGQSLEEIKESVYRYTLDQVDFAVLLENPRNDMAIPITVWEPELENEQWNLRINEYLYQRMLDDIQHWSVEQISDQLPYKSPFGNIYIFRNLDRYAKRNK
jgi:hypothetical protein